MLSQMHCMAIAVLILPLCMVRVNGAKVGHVSPGRVSPVCGGAGCADDRGNDAEAAPLLHRSSDGYGATASNSVPSARAQYPSGINVINAADEGGCKDVAETDWCLKMPEEVFETEDPEVKKMCDGVQQMWWLETNGVWPMPGHKKEGNYANAWEEMKHISEVLWEHMEPERDKKFAKSNICFKHCPAVDSDPDKARLLYFEEDRQQHGPLRMLKYIGTNINAHWYCMLKLGKNHRIEKDSEDAVWLVERSYPLPRAVGYIGIPTGPEVLKERQKNDDMRVHFIGHNLGRKVHHKV